MPKFLKDNTIVLLDGGIESYLMALYGMAMPSLRSLRKPETKYAPIVGLYGAAAELLVKGCLVQAKGSTAMYKNGDISAGVYRFGSEVIEDLRRYIRDEDGCISYIWGNAENHDEQKNQLLHCLGKFKLHQELRANGLHAGLGCSRDITIATATDVYTFIQLLSQSKKLRPYLKNVPAPEATIRDREAIIEDLSRRLRSTKDDSTKVGLLRGMYLVLPYVPEMKPDWVDAFDRIAASPPTEGDLSYLAKTLSDAHSIYLLKNRGGKEGVPVRVDPKDPDALPVAIQNIKRTLSTTPDKFYNDILTANTRLDESRLDLPIDDFLVDLYALGLEDAGVLTTGTQKLTAQQVWPFVAAAYSTNGTPRPCWFIIKHCDEMDQLIAFLKRAEKCGNGYFKRRLPELLKALVAYKNGTHLAIGAKKGGVFSDIPAHKEKLESLTAEQLKPFNPVFLRKYPLSEQANNIVREFISDTKNAGSALCALLELDSLTDNDRKAALALLPLCYDSGNKNGLISVLRTVHMKNYISNARKMMFFADFIENGPQF
jgi:hypothetical protein